VGSDEQGGVGKEDTIRPKRGRKGINTPSDVGTGLGRTSTKIICQPSSDTNVTTRNATLLLQ